jgi:hypothetical protein
MAADGTTLEIPKDIAKRLDIYADALSTEFQFPVTRQQAFERFMRAMLPNAPAPAEVANA